MTATIDELQASVAALEKRLRLAEDRLAIYQLMSSYGPAVDSGSSQATAALWTEGGVYDAQVGSWTGREDIAGMVEGATHQEIIHEGSAHVIGMPTIRIDGDTATAFCYARLYRWAGDGFHVWRITANRWDLVREADGWRVKNRVNRQLDGSEAARALLREAVSAKPE